MKILNWLSDLLFLGIFFIFPIIYVLRRIFFHPKKDVIPVKAMVVGIRAVHEEITPQTNKFKQLLKDQHNGYLVTYYPVVHYMLNNTQYEAVVQTPMDHRPRIDVPMDVLVDVHDLGVAYEVAQVEKNSLILYFIQWGIGLILIGGAVWWIVRHSALSI